MKKTLSIFILITTLLSFSSKVSADNSITLYVSQSDSTATITAKYLGADNCSGDILVTDNKNPPIYSKLSPISFTAGTQSATVELTGLTKGETYNAMANCSGSLAKATSQVSTFTFGSISPDNNAPYDVSPQKYDNSVDTYNLLAPIGGLKSITTNGGTCPIDPKMAGGIGCYLNIIFKIGIGLAGALSVIMIVIGGVQYMGNESIFGKNEAKSKIMSAILGLLIALGAFALLNTINPDLTGAKGVQIDQVSAEIDEAPILSDANTSVPSGTTNSFADCPGGVRKVGTTGGNFIFCSAYASKLQQMFSDAYHANPSIFLSGGGFRTHDSQIALRNKNCPDPKLTVPSSSCHPPTARPGTSNHEQGLAVDLTCDGELINWQTNKSAHDYQPKFPINQKTKKCFDWLASNAGNYGFKNLSSENWHWSTGPNAGR